MLFFLSFLTEEKYRVTLFPPIMFLRPMILVVVFVCSSVGFRSAFARDIVTTGFSYPDFYNTAFSPSFQFRWVLARVNVDTAINPAFRA